MFLLTLLPTWQMLLMNIFPQLAPKLANEISSTTNDHNSCLEYLNITDQRFCFTPTNCSQVFSLLNKLSKSKATGLDKISARLIRREWFDLLFSVFARSLIVLWLLAYSQMTGNVLLKLLIYSNREVLVIWAITVPFLLFLWWLRYSKE